MVELTIASAGFILGVAVSLILFRYGMNFATKFIYRIKEDIPLQEIGSPTDQDGTI